MMASQGQRIDHVSIQHESNNSVV